MHVAEVRIRVSNTCTNLTMPIMFYRNLLELKVESSGAAICTKCTDSRQYRI